jgi:hypothetical protein
LFIPRCKGVPARSTQCDPTVLTLVPELGRLCRSRWE